MSIRWITFLILLLLVSIAGNFVLFYHWQHDDQDDLQYLALQNKYPFLAKRILLNSQSDKIINFLPLRNKIHQSVAPYQNDFAMYFEYLPTGVSIGINQDDQFTAASLLKVPVVMAYYHRKERLGITQDPTVVIQPNELNNKFGNLYKKGAGYQINLADAVKLALQESDNTASLILADHITNEDFNDVYEGLDVPMTLDKNNPTITTFQYTSILKALFFSSVLKKDDSQEILQIMTGSKFHDMLPSGVPDGVLVAHKIGLINTQIYQDCGIVYVPNRPYSLCMVSKGERKEAVSRMHEVSKIIYDYISSVDN